MKKKLIITAALTAALMAAGAIGGTIAYFTSEAKTEINLTAGTVKVESAVELVKATSLGVTRDDEKFENGGTYALNPNTAVLTLNKVTPGDAVVLKVTASNASDVNIKWRMMTECSGNLAAGLEFKVYTDAGLTQEANAIGVWSDVTTDQNLGTYYVVVGLPEEAGNEYQGTQAEIALIIEAVQGNKETQDATFVNPSNAQAKLDEAEDGQELTFMPGTYDKLYLRALESDVHIENSGNWAGGADVIRYRAFNNLTIAGSQGTILKGFVPEAADYTPSGNQHSNSATVPYLASYLQFNNVKFKNLQFNLENNAAAFGSGRIGFDGITFEGCKFISLDDSQTRIILNQGQSDRQLTIKDSTETVELTTKKNVSIINCEMKNLYQIVNFNGLNGFDFEGNSIDGMRMQGILIVKNANLTDGVKGNITIKGNTVINNDLERFLRLNQVEADAVVLVANNTVNGAGDSGSMAKVTAIAEGAQVSFTNNLWNGEDDATALAAGHITY